MVRHLVFWKLNKELRAEDRQEAARAIKEGLEGLAGVVPELLEIQVGVNFNPDGWDLALDSVLESKQALDGYQAHPEHQRMRAYIHTVICERAVVDYEF